MQRRRSRATTVAVMTVSAVAAALLLAACGLSIRIGADQHEVSYSGLAHYSVLTGAVRLPISEADESRAPMWVSEPGQSAPPTVPEVPSSAGKWWFVPGAYAGFGRDAKVALLATGGRPGVRFNLFWEETCGGYRFGRHGVTGGSGASAVLTLREPALILLKRLIHYGTYDGCYLAATVSMHTRTWQQAKSAAPTIQVIHYS